jgi:hypothetical protein
VIGKRLPNESSESVNLVVSLLVRHPELSRVTIKERFASIAFFFAVREAVSEEDAKQFRGALAEHLRAFHTLGRERPSAMSIRLRTQERLTFIEVERDAATLTGEEIALLVAVVAQAWGERLIVNPPADDSGDEEFAMQEDRVVSALEAVRRGSERKRLVGLREERRVLVYFGK